MKKILSPSKSRWFDLFLLLISGVFGCFVNMYFFTLGVAASNADLAAVFQPVTPILTGMFTVLVGLESFSYYKLVGIIVSCGGTILVLILDGIESSDVETFSYIAFALNAGGAASYSICQKPLINNSGYKTFFLTAFAMTSAFLPMSILVVSTILHDTSRADDFLPKVSQIPALLYCSIGVSFVGYSGISYANRHLDATIVNMYLILQPVSTAILSLILGYNQKTSASWSLWVSMVLIFVGLFITTVADPEQHLKEEDQEENEEKLPKEGNDGLSGVGDNAVSIHTMMAPLLEEA